MLSMVIGSLHAQSTAEMRVFETWQAWAAQQRPGGDLLERYREFLAERRGDSVDVESDIRTIRKVIALRPNCETKAVLLKFSAGRAVLIPFCAELPAE